MSTYRAPQRHPAINYVVDRSFFITATLKNHRRDFLDARLAQYACGVFRKHRDDGLFYLYAFCVMPDHFHLYLRLRNSGRHLSHIVGSVKAGISRGACPKVYWQRGFWDRAIRGTESAAAFAQYVLMNPVRAGLVQDYREYPYSGSIDAWY
ncbi:MAG TPA: transposase [Candidatus Eremiobacteraceae bacterium]|nr:transposase [Candidatus Eremiobacteraceae bacterium]